MVYRSSRHPFFFQPGMFIQVSNRFSSGLSALVTTGLIYIPISALLYQYTTMILAMPN